MRYQNQSINVQQYPRAAIVAMGIGLAVLLAGCGTAAAASKPAAGTSGSSSAASSHTSSGTTPTASGTVQVGKAVVNGTQRTVLSNSQGLTLYYFTKDTTTQSKCTGACATLWHPLLTSSATVSPVSGLKGTLSVVSDVHGRQIAYNGHLLYLYSGDTKPGQTKGEGLLHTWWVATPSLATGASASPASSYGGGSSSGSSSSGSSSGSGW